MQPPEDLSKEQLISDLTKLRQRINDLEKIEEDKKRYEEELAHTKAMYKGLFEFAPDALVVVDRAGRIVQVNQQAERLFGYRREELLQADHDILVPERYREKHREDRREYMSGPHIRQMGTGLELYGQKKDGSEFPVDISLGPLQTNDDMVVLAVVRDFTERKKAEENLKRALADLQRAHKELESFSYSVSHDLRQPLRIVGFQARMLLKDLEGKLDEETQRRFDVIQEKAQQMDQLIENILALARLGHQVLTMTPIDMERLATKVWNELQEHAQQQNVIIDISKMTINCVGDYNMLSLVLTNLLSNALKFTKEREKATIDVGSSENANECVYYVKDNGIGFDMQLADKLFKSFQRLHAEEEYEGIGVGLSFVKQIIERHGGRVWAEGKVNEGATFYFTLPKPSNS